VSARDRALDALLARDDIRELPLRYAAALNRGDVEAMVELFAPGARFGRYGEGHEALRALTRDSVEGAHVIVVLVANHLIDLVSPDEATGEVWAQAISHTEADGYVEQVVKYEDRYVRLDGAWRFARRRHRLLFGRSPVPSPLEQAPAEWPERQVGVGDLALESDAFARWYEARARDERG
jgi:hypothetical protein